MLFWPALPVSRSPQYVSIDDCHDVLPPSMAIDGQFVIVEHGRHCLRRSNDSITSVLSRQYTVIAGSFSTLLSPKICTGQYTYMQCTAVVSVTATTQQ